VTSFYGLDRANERLAELTPVLEALRQQRLEVIALRDRLALARREQGAVTGGRVGSGPRDITPDADAAPGSTLETPRVLALRIQGTIDRMQAGVARLDDWSIQLRDIETGLVDFPALVNGRAVWLCWRLGEPDVAWWHELSAGMAGRRPISELG
jgi:hypothetical protein